MVVGPAETGPAIGLEQYLKFTQFGGMVVCHRTLGVIVVSLR
jgi:hypothetical protein